MADQLDPKQADSVAKSMEKASEASEKLAKNVQLTDRHMESLDKTTKKVADKIGEIKNDTKDSSSLFEGIKDEIDEISDELADLVRESNKLQMDKKLSPTDAERVHKSLKSVKTTLMKMRVEKDPAKIKTLKENIKETKKQLSSAKAVLLKFSGIDMSDLQEGVGSIRGAFGAIGRKSPREMKYALEGVADFSRGLKVAGQNMVRMGGFGKVALGNVAKGLGSLTGGLGGLIGRAGPWAMAAKMIWDMGMAVDQFVKDANKQFARVRGPNIMTEDIKKQFREYNLSIRKTGENLAVGLDYTQINEFVESLTSAGLHIDRVSNKVTSLRDAVYYAAKASKTLGLDLPYVAKIMEVMMNEIRMNLKEVDDAFVRTAFDAQKAGLSTDKFWNAIENASASMSFYGLFIKAASENMKKFTESQVVSTRDAAEMTEELGTAFAKMTDEQKAAFVGLVGPEKVKKMFEETAKQWKAKAFELTTKIEVARESGDMDEVKRLIAERARAEGIANRLMKGYYSKNAAAMGQFLPMLADRTEELLLEFIKSRIHITDTAEATGEQMILAKKALEHQGFSSGLIEKLIGVATANKANLEYQIGIGEESVYNSESLISTLMKVKEGNGTVAKNIEDLVNATRSGDKKDASKFAKILYANLKSAGFTEDNAKLLTKLVYLGTTGKNNMSSKLYKIFKQGVSATYNSSEELSKDLSTSLADINTKDLTEATDELLVTQEDLKERSIKSFDELVKQTLSFNEMAKMAGDEAEWRLKSLGFLSSINGAVFGIFEKVVMGKGGREQTKEKEKKEKEATAKIITARGGKVMGKGSLWPWGKPEPIIGEKERVDLIEEIVTQSKALQEGLTVLGDVIKSSPQEAIERFDKGYSNITEAINALNPEDQLKAGALMAEIDAQKKALEKANKDVIDFEKQFENKKMNREQKSRLLELKKVREEIAGKLKIDFKDLVDILAGQQTTNTKQLGELSSIDEKNSDIIASLTELVSQTEEGKKSLAGRIAAKMGGNKTKEAFIKATKELGIYDLKKLESVVPTIAEMTGINVGTISSWLGSKGSKQSLRGIERVVKPGILKLDPSEIIAKTVPLMPETAGGAGVARQGTQTFNIYVSGNLEDLPRRIANEIRATIYKERLAGFPVAG